ncbi:putative tRNA amidotransferase domain protein [Caulobacter phage CcrSwift]|uniref:Putative tRNA amidotransferase domain protein n=1 Tax=Caulobacter phage CcrSwift TaxID=2927984 RepID=K4JVN7_9CAUD|nr:tRNA amidotransferase [Caulobacter phage CcrSwift]AFU88465.1 putative tRNA amidotransferase domain protein [Caulobacter phage CcrSwift]
MSLIEKLNNDALAARKAAMRKEAGGEHAVLLATVAADAAMIAKNDRQNPGRDVTDEDVVATLKKHIGGIDTTLAELTKRGRSEEEQSRFIVERRRLEAYLPQTLSGGDLTDAIHATATKLGVDLHVKSTKVIVADLQEQFPGQIDSSEVARYLKNV